MCYNNRDEITGVTKQKFGINDNNILISIQIEQNTQKDCDDRKRNV